MVKQAEIAAQQKVAWEQKQQDIVNLQKEQALVEKAEVQNSHKIKHPSEVAQASAEIDAEHVLAKEREAHSAQEKDKKQHVVHRVDGPRSKAVQKQNAKQERENTKGQKKDKKE